MPALRLQGRSRLQRRNRLQGRSRPRSLRFLRAASPRWDERSRLLTERSLTERELTKRPCLLDFGERSGRPERCLRALRALQGPLLALPARLFLLGLGRVGIRLLRLRPLARRVPLAGHLEGRPVEVANVRQRRHEGRRVARAERLVQRAALRNE